MHGFRLPLALLVAVVAGLGSTTVMAAPSPRAARIARFDSFLAEAVTRYRSAGATPMAAGARFGYSGADLIDPQVVTAENKHVLERYADYRTLLASAPGRDAVPAAAPARPAGSTAPEQLVKGVDDGRTDAATAIEKALAKGDVWLTPGRRYLVSHGITIPANRHIASDGSGTIIVAVGSPGFPDRPFSAAGNGTPLSVFTIHDAANVSLQDFRIQTPIALPGGPQPMVQAVDLQNVDHAVIAGLELRGFARAPAVIRINSSGDVVVADNLIHGSYTSKLIRQVDGISVDADRVRPTPGTPPRTSDHIVIRGNFIFGLVLDASVYLETSLRGTRPLNDETTGIYIGGHTDGPAVAVGTNVIVNANMIADVGQGIDLSCNDGRFSGNYIERAPEFALKVGHGASRNQFTHFTIVASGIAPIVVYASPTEPAADNRFSDFVISYPGAVLGLPGQPSYGLKIEADASANMPAIATATGNLFSDIRFDHLPPATEKRWHGMINCVWPAPPSPPGRAPNVFHGVTPRDAAIVNENGCGVVN